MGIASASFTVYVRGEDPLVLAEDLLHFFSHRFLQPKSVEIHLPGRNFEKVEGSIDGDLFWGKHDLPSQLPGEKVLAGTDFTTLENPDDWLTIPRDRARVMDRLRAYSEESARLWQAKQAMHDQVYWTFWGLCRLVQKLDGTTPKEVFLLRQKLRRAERLVPILRATCNLTRHPTAEFSVKLLLHSFVWSCYTSSFDTARQEWIAKSELELERKNARLLAEAISGFVQRYPNAEIEWETEKEHAPDLRGSVPFELQARFGPQNSPQRVRNLIAK